MPQGEKVAAGLGKAQKLEKYDWLGAAELYEQALSILDKQQLLKRGEIQERLSYCYFRAAFQSDTREEFKKHMRLSLEAYEKAAGLFEGFEDSAHVARASSCRAVVSYCKAWLAKDLSERKTMLDECWKLGKEALKVHDGAGDKAGYGRMCNDLLRCLSDRHMFTLDLQARTDIIKEGITYGEKALEALSEGKDYSELARAYYFLIGWMNEARSITESIKRQEEIDKRISTDTQKLLEIAEKAEDSYIIGRSYLLFAAVNMEHKGDLESALKYRGKALELAKRVNDKRLIAGVSFQLSHTVWWKALVEEDRDKRKEGFNRAIKYDEDAIAHAKILASYPPLVSFHADCVWQLANDEINLSRRKALLEKSIEVGRKYLHNAKRSGSPYSMYTAFHVLSKALFSLYIISGVGEQGKLLQEASKYRAEAIKLGEQLEPFFYWNRGVVLSYLAKIKAEQAKVETNKQRKIKLVEKAALDMEDCLKFMRSHLKARPQTRLFDSLGYFENWLGGILNQLGSLTGEEKHLERAIKVYEGALQTWEKTDRRSGLAETHWQIARLYDDLGEFSKATYEFEAASEKYSLAVEKIPQLKALYTNYATYMQAWSEIEKAKHHHAQQQYGQAKECYEETASLLRGTKRWSYLHHNYLALARLEKAEDFSRKDQAEEGKNLFQEAAKLFIQAKESIEDNLNKVEVNDEREMVARLCKASGPRQEYCLGRTDLEEAKMLDRQGHHAASSTKYASAATKFKRAIESLASDSERRELRPIIDLCHAWAKMTQAEAEANPELFKEASKLFEEAKDHSVDEKAKMLALGHSRFCKALEAGTRFEDARDEALHTLATQHLESAASYYLKADFKSASEYAEATQKLLDAYLYMHNAKTEVDPAKKARFYMIAEKVLQIAAGSYLKAKHPEKHKQAAKLLEKIRREKELALSLTEVLHAPLAISTTATFTTPTPSQEAPMGLERFEHADVQGNLLLRAKEVNVGQNLDFRLELVNAGRTPALLVKVDEMVPEGFEIEEVPEAYSVENSYINLRGKRLNPLKTEDVKITMKPNSKGTFTITPRILYLTETGKYRSHEPEPVTITVKELGISGWIKGER